MATLWRDRCGPTVGNFLARLASYHDSSGMIATRDRGASMNGLLKYVAWTPRPSEAEW